MIEGMTREEFQAVLDESLMAFREEVKSEITKAVDAIKPAPVADGDDGEDGAVTKADLDAISTDISAKLEAALTPITETVDGLSEVVDKVLDRMEGLAKRAVIKRSIDAQDGEEDDTDKRSPLQKAMVAALQGRKVEVV